MVTEEREVAGFDRVALSSLGSLTINQGDRESLTVEGPADLMPRITTEVKDGTLVLGLKKGAWLKGLRNKKATIRYCLTMRDVAGIVLSGAGKIDAPGVSTDSLEIVVSGAGKLALDSLSASSLSVVMSGVGECEVSGKACAQSVTISGAGSYKAGTLESDKAAVVVSGTGGVTVFVSDTLDVQVSGTGSVRYLGGPTVRQRITGIGSVECVCE
jgi:hypothetical protein